MLNWVARPLYSEKCMFPSVGTPTPVLLTVPLAWAMFYMPFFPPFILLRNVIFP